MLQCINLLHLLKSNLIKIDISSNMVVAKSLIQRYSQHSREKVLIKPILFIFKKVYSYIFTDCKCHDLFPY